MEYQKLTELFEGRLDIGNFLLHLKDDVITYIDSSSNPNKDTTPIYSNDSVDDFDSESLVKILYLYIQDDIFEWELEYILSFLELSYLGDEEKTEQVIFNLANPYLNYPISKYNVNQSILYLKGNVNELNLKGVDIRLKQKGKGYRPNYKSKILKKMNSNSVKK